MEELAKASAVDSPPDYFDWVLGWRHFVILDDGTCKSCTPAGGGYVWERGENKAICGAGMVDVIHEGHHCGLNAFFEPNNMMYGSLHALVRGRGDRFAIHPNGFRAEYVEILAFVGGRNPGKEMEAAAEKYGVPLFKRRWTAEKWAKKNQLGEWFPKDRRPKSEIFASVKKPKDPDWNEVMIGSLDNFLSNQYLIFVTTVWVFVLVGFIFGAMKAGGVI